MAGRNAVVPKIVTQRNPEEAARRYKEFFERNPMMPKLMSKFGSDSDSKLFRMSKQHTVERVDVEMGGSLATFSIKCGPLVWNAKPMENAWLLEVRYRKSGDSHAIRLPLGEFGSMIAMNKRDVARMEAGESLAQAFVMLNGLKFSTHVSSWPQFRATVIRPTEKS